MSDNIETVLVKGWAKEGHEAGVLINKSDFDSEKHELFDAPEKSEGDEFLKRNVDEIKADLEALNDEELITYRAAEVAGKNRAGLLTAINAEVEKRKN